MDDINKWLSEDHTYQVLMQDKITNSQLSPRSYNPLLKFRCLSSYKQREVVQAEPSCSNDGMDWRSVVAIIVGVDATGILPRHASALALVNCAGPLVVVHMAEENQIHLLPYVRQTASCLE